MILEIKHVYKDYFSGNLVVPVLKDINLQVEEGEYLAIMGLFVFLAHYGAWGVQRLTKKG